MVVLTLSSTGFFEFNRVLLRREVPADSVSFNESNEWEIRLNESGCDRGEMLFDRFGDLPFLCQY